MSVCDQPILLRPDLFTPLTRTPWAGFYIAKDIKNELGSGAANQIFGYEVNIPDRIGESWEFSCDPELPSEIMPSGISLNQLLKVDGEAILGRDLWLQTGAVCELLIKYINASEPLSVQVHPNDSDCYLTANECGKPESWYVLHAEPGAGFYLGFKSGVTKSQLAEALWGGRSIEPLLHFHVAKAGTFYDIPPATPHALGGGLTVLEPQRIRSGKSGKTYRMWDWNRKYRPNGSRDDQTGALRQLHIDEALSLVQPELQVGYELLPRLEISGIDIERSGYLIRQFKSTLGWTLTAVNSFMVDQLEIYKSVGYCVVLCTKGKMEIGTADVVRPLWAGMTVLIPNALQKFSVNGLGEFLIVQPSTTQWELFR